MHIWFCLVSSFLICNHVHTRNQYKTMHGAVSIANTA